MSHTAFFCCGLNKLQKRRKNYEAALFLLGVFPLLQARETASKAFCSLDVLAERFDLG
jgi:hypothetical protein